MSEQRLEYKGYQGSVEVSLEDDVLHGKILRITDLVTFEAKTPDGLRQAFEQEVDEYLVFCEEEGVAPDKPFSYDEEDEHLSDLEEEATMFLLIADIRAAVGDAEGRLMQDELVTRIRTLRRLAEEDKLPEEDDE